MSEKLKDLVVGHVDSRNDWIAEDEKIIKKRLGFRKKRKNYPYKGAPNFVEPIIDDITTDKTEQEVSMMFNAPHLAHVVPLSQMDSPTRVAIEAAFDSYVRYFLKARPKIENATDTCNARGFSITKQIREYNRILKTVIASFEVPDIRNIIVPTDVIVECDLEKAPFICEVHRYPKEDFKRIARKNKWKNIDEVAEACISTDRVDANGTDDDTQSVTKDIVGITTSKETEYVIVWELYHYAEEDMGLGSGYPEGTRVLSIFCPDLPDKPLKRVRWKEADEVRIDTIQNAMGRVIGQEAVKVEGEDRAWPYVQHRAENRSKDFYDTRGVGHRCMDDQIFATHVKNMNAVLLEYYGQPLLKATGKVANSGNISFEPGSVLPQGLDFAQTPQIPPSMEFMVNSTRAVAGKRMGANNAYNYSQNVSSTRKVQKTASEIQDSQAQSAAMSSSSVDRFNEPWAVQLQLIWDDMRRLKVEFPVVIPGIGQVGFATADIYRHNIMLIPAGSSKTLNPDIQIQRSMMIADWAIAKAQMVGLDITNIVRDVLSNWDSRTAHGWLLNKQGMQPINALLQQLDQNIQQLAQGGKQSEQRITNIETLLRQLMEGQQ